MFNLFHSPVISKMVPASIPFRQFHLQFNQRQGDRGESESLIDYQFSSHDIVTVTICTFIGLWYIFQKVKSQPPKLKITLHNNNL
jgi:hypothetical protein